MGYMRHNAIVVTSWKTEAIEGVAAFARELGLRVLGPDAEVINLYRTMLICPDGSKEGWDASDEADVLRAKFKAFLGTHRWEDGSSPLAWVEIAYGSDDREAVIEDDEWRSASLAGAYEHAAEQGKDERAE